MPGEDDAPAPLTRLWASTELARRAQERVDAYVVAPGPDPLVSLRALTRALLVDHILAELLIRVVTDADFDRIRDELQAVL